MSSIRDVAKLAGVSTATVSRVLNDDRTYKMTDATRTRVQQAAASLGYAIRKREVSSGMKIGCVLSVTKEKYADQYFMSILSGIEEQLTLEGLSLIFLKTFMELEDEAVLAHTFSAGITGIILMETLNDRTYDYIRRRVPHMVGIDTMREEIDNIGYDHHSVSAMMTNHLIEKGHTKIAYTGGSGDTGNIRCSRRYQGFVSALRIHGLDVNPDWVMDCRWDAPLCIEQVKRLIQLPDRPTALFAASDIMAMAALSGLYSQKIRVPEEMAVIGLSDIELSKYANPPLSTIHIPTREIGILAVKTLMARIGGDTTLPKRIHLPGTLVAREST